MATFEVIKAGLLKFVFWNVMLVGMHQSTQPNVPADLNIQVLTCCSRLKEP